MPETYSHVVRLQATQYDAHSKQWVGIPSRLLGNPLSDEPWQRLYPLRISIIGKTKCGVAENPRQFREIIESLGSPSKRPYELEKRLEEEYVAKNKPKADLLRAANSELREANGLQ